MPKVSTKTKKTKETSSPASAKATAGKQAVATVSNGMPKRLSNSTRRHMRTFKAQTRRVHGDGDESRKLITAEHERMAGKAKTNQPAK
ncbi:MAG: hypothetical protein HY455_03220 [Parcubacteria group bacterium]|nr:hypothetical protein [Parcubacteria group bacterium]